jgi:hypothetical protein
VNTVAITYAENEPALIVPFEEAQSLYEHYKALTLTHPEDQQLFHALVIALDILPPAALNYSEGEQTVAARKIAEWKKDQP